MGDEAKELAEAAKLPIDERAAHSNWKVRSAAYEHIKASCSSVFDPSDPLLSTFVGILPKASADSNAAALDKALEALQAFLEKASGTAAGRIAGTCSSNIVAKGLGARPSTAAKGVDCLMALLEVEQADKVTGALVEGYGNKVPKVVVGALDATLQLIRAFGGRVMPAQQILKAMPPLFESKDAKARDKAKEIVAELARWMGPELIRASLFEKMRDAQKEDVEKLLQEAPAGRPKPERLTRKAAANAAEATDAGDEGSGAGVAVTTAGASAAAAEEPEKVDSYEFAEPKDIIPQLTKEFWSALESAKWSERKAALTTLKELASYPKLANGDYADVNREIKKITTKDSNVQVVAEAINCTANIAKGLRKDYKGPAMSLCSVLLEKFKDKSSVVNKAAGEALDAMARYSFTLADVAEDVAAALAHQNPKVKEYSLNWLTGCVMRETKAGVLKLQPLVVPAAVKCTDEGAPSIREAAFNFLVQAVLKAGSLTAMGKGLAKMDEAKRKKLEEMVQEAAKARSRPGAAAATAPSVARQASRNASRPASGGTSPVTSPRSSTTGNAAAKPAVNPSLRSSSAVRSSTASKPPAGPGRPKAAAAAGGGAGAAAGGGGVEDEAALTSGLLSSVDVKAMFIELFGEETVAALADPLWKVRLEAMETVLAKAQDAAEHASLLTQGMAHLPGWDEKNFQVMAKQFEVIRSCAAQPSFGRREALVAVQGGADKLADIKLKESAFQMLLAASEAVGPLVVATLLHKKAAGHKNPKVLTEAINWINLAVTEFLLPAFDVQTLIDWAKEDLGSANAATRTAAIQLLGCLHAFLGPGLADMVRGELKPALMAAVEVEFGKQPQQSGWQAKRVSRAAGKASARSSTTSRGEGGKGSSAAAAAAADDTAPNMDDLLPRADISGQITSELIGKLGSANWKERKEALDEVERILAAAGGRIQPCVGDLMPALKSRMNDSNKNLIAQALGLLGKLAKAMGRAITREARVVLGPAVKCICDSKHTVRTAVVEMLEAWVSVATADAPFDEMVEVLPSPKCVSEGMQAGIAWMATVYAAGKGTSTDCLSSGAKAVAIGASYKTVPVREAANQLLDAMITAVGLPDVQSAVQGIPKDMQKSVAEALAKAGAAAGAAAAAVPASRPGTAGGSIMNATNKSSSRAGSALSKSVAAGSVSSRPGTASSGLGRSVAAGVGGSSMSRGAAAGLAAALAADEGALLSMDKNKEDRAKKARFRSTKFEIRPDDVQQLEVDLGALASPILKANLFAKDFKKHVLAADALKNWVSNNPDEAVEPCIACLDLLLKWAVVRLAEGNTQTLVGVTGMLKVLLDLLADRDYRLSEAEVKVFMPGLVEKCGQPTPQMKAECRDLIRRVGSMYPPTKVISYIQEGLNSKNNRSRVTCAEEIGWLVDKEGPKVYAGSKCDVLAALAKLVAEPGKEIRAAALGALEVAYAFEGEGIWKQVGSLSGQQKGILEERLKTIDKDLSKKGLTAGYKRSAYDAQRQSQAVDSSSPGGTAAAAAGPGGGFNDAGVGHAQMGRVSRDYMQPVVESFVAGGGAAAGQHGAAFTSRPPTAGTAGQAAGTSQAGYGAVRPGSSGAGYDSHASAQHGSSGVDSAIGSAGDSLGGFMSRTSSLGSRFGSVGGTGGMFATTDAGYVASGVGAMQQGLAGQQAGGSNSGWQAPDQQQQQQQGGATAAATAGAGGSSIQVQPLQSFTDHQELEAEFKRCLEVLGTGQLEDAVEVMKLLCFEMMDLQRQQAAAAAAARGEGAAAGADGSSSSLQLQAVQHLLVQHADQLALLLARQTKQMFQATSAHMRAGNLPAALNRACKYALNTLMSIFASPAIAAGVSASTLAVLIQVLLLQIVHDDLGRMPAGEALLKACNMLILKILDNSNRNYTFSALLTLLLECPPELVTAVNTAAQQPLEKSRQDRWTDLVVKCLIKNTKLLPQHIQSLDMRSLLLSIHGFFEALGVDGIRQRSNTEDKPLRMVKTLLHEVCKLKGTDIYRYTAGIPQQGSTSGIGGKPVILTYIDLNIQTQGMGALRTSSAAAPTAAAGAGSAGGMQPVTPGRGLATGSSNSNAAALRSGAMTPGTLRAQKDAIVGKLSAVFTRLSAHMQASSKDSTEKRAVLMDIYNITQEQGMPIDKLMAMYLPEGQITPAFRGWIAGELRKVEEEQQQQQGEGSAATAAAATPAIGSTSAKEGPSGLGAAYFAMNKAGLGGGSNASNITAATASTAAAGGSQKSSAGGTDGSTMMEALKARMSQLQSEKNKMLQSAAKQAIWSDSSPGGGAADSSDAAGSTGGSFRLATGCLTAGLGATLQSGKGLHVSAVTGGSGSDSSTVIGTIGTDVAAAGSDTALVQQQTGLRNLQDLRSRMKDLAGL